MAGVPNPTENAGWIGDIESAIFWLIGTATVIVGWVTRIIAGHSRRMDEHEKRLDAAESRAAHDRDTFSTALTASIADRRALFAGTQQLRDEHARIRETLAGQPSKDDLAHVEDRLARLIQGRSSRP